MTVKYNLIFHSLSCESRFSYSRLRKYIKNSSISLSLITFFSTGTLSQAPYPYFEIVESISVETNLDNPEIRNTKEIKY